MAEPASNAETGRALVHASRGPAMTEELTGPASRLANAASLTAALRHHGTIGVDTTVTSARPTPVGHGQMADSFRIELEFDPPGAGPASLVAKLPGTDAAGEVGRSSGVYSREHRFYTELVPQLPYAGRTATKVSASPNTSRSDLTSPPVWAPASKHRVPRASGHAPGRART